MIVSAPRRPVRGTMIEHYVLFQAKAGREADVDGALAEFDIGMGGAPWLIELTYGPNLNSRSRELGWSHGMLSRLPDMQTVQNEYWNHPAHVRFMERLDECCEARFALDHEVPGPEEASP